MTEEIMEGICAGIFHSFGREYRIYREKPEQGFKRPGFFVERTGGSMELFRGKRYFMKNACRVTYYPPYEGRKGDMDRVGDELALCLQLLDLDTGGLRGQIVSLEKEKDCLVCCVNYDFFVTVEDMDIEETGEMMWEYKLEMEECE